MRNPHGQCAGVHGQHKPGAHDHSGGNHAYRDVYKRQEIYVENDGKVMLNIEKLFESAVNKAEEKTGLLLDFIRNKLTEDV